LLSLQHALLSALQELSQQFFSQLADSLQKIQKKQLS
jgi:chemotaxis protein CheY-P-specific phosphatase CheC